jgi:hypothetical protein
MPPSDRTFDAMRRRYLLTLHVLVYGEAACPISGCAQCARLRVEEYIRDEATRPARRARHRQAA